MMLTKKRSGPFPTTNLTVSLRKLHKGKAKSLSSISSKWQSRSTRKRVALRKARMTPTPQKYKRWSRKIYSLRKGFRWSSERQGCLRNKSRRRGKSMSSRNNFTSIIFSDWRRRWRESRYSSWKSFSNC